MKIILNLKEHPSGEQSIWVSVFEIKVKYTFDIVTGILTIEKI